MITLTVDSTRDFESRVTTVRAAELRSKALVDPKIGRQDIFLSHSQRDASLIPGILAFFDTFSASVYVDVLDNSFPSPPSPFTAQQVKQRIYECRRLVVLVSQDNTPTSKWIPWEMGIADGLKTYEHVALLLVGRVASVTSWLPNQEYFGLYPRIIRGPVALADFPNISGDSLQRSTKQRSYSMFSSSADWLVMSPSSRGIWKLSDWLADPLA